MPRGRASVRRALGAYVAGHDRGWTADRKRQTGGTDREEELTPTFEEPRARRGNRMEIPVPDRLDFHRGPDIWRSRQGDTTGGGGRT